MIEKLRNLNILMKIKELWHNGAFHVLCGSFLNKFVSMFASIIIVRLLSKQDYGLLAYIENIYNYAIVFAGFGLSNSILRFVVLEKDIQRKKSYYTFAVKYGLLINSVIVIIFCLLNFLMSPQDGFMNARNLLFVMIFALPFQNLTDNQLFLERAMFENSRYAYFSFFILCSLVIARILGAIINGIWGVVTLLVFCYLFVSLILLFNIKNKYFKNISCISLTRPEKKKVFSYSFQYMITNGLWTVFMLNGTFLLGQLSNNANLLADFKVAYVLPGCLGILSGAIGTYIAPYFIKNEDNPIWIKNNFIKTIIVTFVVLSFSAIGCIIFEKYIILFVYGERYLSVIPVMNILLLAAVINGAIRYTIANILAAIGKIKYNMITSIIGIICQFAFSFLLVPSMGALGTAFVEVITYSVMSILLVFFFNKEYKFFHRSV